MTRQEYLSIAEDALRLARSAIGNVEGTRYSTHVLTPLAAAIFTEMVRDFRASQPRED